MARPKHSDSPGEAALAAAGDLGYCWELRGDRIDWFGPAAELLGADPAAAATGDGFHGLIDPDDLPTRIRALTRHFASHTRLDCEYRLRIGDDPARWVHERAVAEFGQNGEPVRVRGVLRVLPDRRDGVDRLELLTNIDGLTGYFNRPRLQSAIEQSLVQSRREKSSGGYLAVDIDNLRFINDAFGPESGDEVILGLGERLQEVIRASDAIGRVEGDGFGLLLERCDEAQLQVAADRIVRTARETPIPTRSGPIAVTVTIGGVVFPTRADSAHEVMLRAEAALHQAKASGRNHFALYRRTDGQRDAMRRDMAMVSRVQHALGDGRMTLAFQPIVHAGSRAPALYECLIRMRDPDGAVVPAAAFVPVVERLGLMRQIDRQVLQMAVRELHVDPTVDLAFNISGLTVADQSWLRGLVALLRDRPEIARRLVVEITETAALQDIEESKRFVGTVRELGCRVALDDFGAGYSSFRHLKALGVDMVKIDGAFVRNVAHDPGNRLFVRTLVGLAGAFGLTCVAECVETAEEAELLAHEGIDLLQGYHFGRPELMRSMPPGQAKIIPIARAG